MKLVADSGSSQTDWILQLSDNEISGNYSSKANQSTYLNSDNLFYDTERLEFKTAGLNPYFLAEKEIIKAISHVKVIQPYFQEVDEVYFFGAGCSSPDKRELVSNALSTVFKNAFVSVDSDVVSAAYACCGTTPGISCILGTGSNISYFDGSEVIPGNRGLGYIFEDEASGSYFGKQLITDYLYGKMPHKLSKNFKNIYMVTKESILTAIYQKPFPNIYLATFAPFLSKFKNHPYCIDLLKTGFNAFIYNNIKSYTAYDRLPCHFVGSIAFHFKELLIDCCLKENINVGKIIEHPIEELFNFICHNEPSQV